MRSHIKYLLFSSIISVLIFSIGCATPTKPNAVYQGSLPDKFDILTKKNPLLAKEIRKLPELQDGISPQEASALENIVKLYNDDPIVFDNAFKKMYQVGLPDFRKYCSPLQALFWLAEDGRLRKEDNLLVDYSLDKLLRNAWKFEKKFLILSEKEAKKVIEGLIDEWEKKSYSKVSSMESIKIMLLSDYNRNPNMFSKEARQIINISLRENLKWGDFDEVTDRLNAPELLNYYERSRFGYRTGLGYDGNAYYVFKFNTGNCIYITAFTLHCLRKGGYKAREHHVESPSGRFPYHEVCLFEWNGKKYIMDNGRPDKSSRRGIIPFDEYDPFSDNPQ